MCVFRMVFGFHQFSCKDKTVETTELPGKVDANSLTTNIWLCSNENHILFSHRSRLKDRKQSQCACMKRLWVNCESDAQLPEQTSKKISKKFSVNKERIVVREFRALLYHPKLSWCWYGRNISLVVAATHLWKSTKRSWLWDFSDWQFLLADAW